MLNPLHTLFTIAETVLDAIVPRPRTRSAPVVLDVRANAGHPGAGERAAATAKSR